MGASKLENMFLRRSKAEDIEMVFIRRASSESFNTFFTRANGMAWLVSLNYV